MFVTVTRDVGAAGGISTPDGGLPDAPCQKVPPSTVSFWSVR